MNIINFFRTITGFELSYVLLFMVVIDIGFAALARKSLLSSSLRRGALIKIGYSLIPALMSWGEDGLDFMKTATDSGDFLITSVISVFFILIFIAELVSIAGYYRVINPTATNILAKFANKFAPAEVKNKMDKLGVTELLKESTDKAVSEEQKKERKQENED